MSFTCEVNRAISQPRRSQATVGVDVAIRHLAVRSARRQLGREHARVANAGHGSLHQLTTELIDTYGTIVIERLNLAGLMRNRRLADASFGKLRQQLAYKSVWAGSTLVEAGRFSPSSKICPGCGYVKAKRPLSERR